MLNQIKHIE